jgi:predicted DCC family thiol-disulfide oxidoreductase YuxK
VIFYDGGMRPLRRFVQFSVPARDPDGYFPFRRAAVRLRALGASRRPDLRPTDFDTMVLIENGRGVLESTAALRVLRRLRGPWPVFYASIVVPRPIRDFVYGWIARNRKRWFAPRRRWRAEQPGWSERFIDAPSSRR